MSSDATGTPFSILIIDDDYDIRESLVEILQDEGYIVLTASHGAAAFELLKSVTPNIIFLDLNMPVMNGAQFREIQRNDPALSSIPTVIMTAVDQREERVADMGIDEVLPKPLKLEPLLSLISRYRKKAGM